MSTREIKENDYFNTNITDINIVNNPRSLKEIYINTNIIADVYLKYVDA